MQVELPIQCACGFENRAYEDFIHNRIVVECRCGTRLRINKEEWFYLSQVQMAREIRRCCCDRNRREK